VSIAPLLLAQGTVSWSIGFVALIMAAIVFWMWAIWMVTTGWSKSRELARRHELKRLMIERGMSADEIERILAAGTGKQIQLPTQDETLPPAKPQAGPMKWPVHSQN
jgi:hypothetical protein